MYASDLTWKRSYHNEGARIGILFLHCQLQEDKNTAVRFNLSVTTVSYYDLILRKKFISWNFNESNLT